MYAMSVTLETSHFEISPLNLSASENNCRVLGTLDTSQDPIGPCKLLEQSVDTLVHSITAVWSCALSFGANPAI